MKKQDYLLIAALLAVSLVLMLVFRLAKAPGAQVVVRVSGEVIATYSLDEDRCQVIEGKNGGTNTLVIQDGTVCLSEATCPDLLCVHQGTISREGESIVCLPNQVVVEVQEETEGEEASYDILAK